MGARGVEDVGVKSQGPHGHERRDAVATDDEESEEEDPHYKRRTPIAFLASRASLVRWTIASSSTPAAHVSA